MADREILVQQINRILEQTTTYDRYAKKQLESLLNQLRPFPECPDTGPIVLPGVADSQDSESSESSETTETSETTESSESTEDSENSESSEDREDSLTPNYQMLGDCAGRIGFQSAFDAIRRLVDRR
jgi:hypothetical protein